jgi:transposase-like protein
MDDVVSHTTTDPVAPKLAEPTFATECESPLPKVLRRECEADYRRQFVAEYHPIGPTEWALVKDLARRAAGMDRWNDGATAIERRAAQGLHGLVDFLPGDNVDGDDAILAAVLGNASADCAERHSLAQTRAFHRSRQALEALQARRKAANGAVIPPPFPDEAACIRFLEERLRSGQHGCPYCGARAGCALRSRHVWECAQCRRQIGLRGGTVMARSPLSLWTWFQSIRLLLWNPTIGTDELSRRIDVCRRTTVRTIARRVRDAIASDHATDLLAGLDQHFARPWAPEPGVHIVE